VEARQRLLHAATAARAAQAEQKDWRKFCRDLRNSG
jgi:hypothetical protein